MRAIQFSAVGEDPALTKIPIPEPLAGQVRVAMRACGICGSDLHVIDGSTTTSHQPITMGHEPSAVIDAVGDGVDPSQVGRRVVVNPLVSCRQCVMCHVGSSNLCLQLRILGIGMDGAHAEFFLAPADNVVPLPENVDFATGAIVTDAVATPMHAIRLSGLRAGDTAAVFGLGGLGIHAAMILKQVFGVKVIGVDTYDGALERAPGFGVDEVVDARGGKAGHLIKELTDAGVDAAFDFVGSPAVVEQALRSLRPGGTCVAVGVTPERLGLALHQDTLVARELRLVGSFGFHQSDIVELLDLIDNGRLTIAETISHRFALEDYELGLAALRDRSSNPIRVVITADAETG